MDYLDNIGARAKAAQRILSRTAETKKNDALLLCAKRLVEKADTVTAQNELDISAAKQRGISDAMLDRLRLTRAGIEAMANGISQVASLENPVGEVLSMKERPNGLLIGQKRVPLGVIGIIYESRPNVTADAFALCFKTSNAVILRGGSDAINSNKIICEILRGALAECGLPEDCVILIEDTSREVATGLMRLNDYLDVLIPRGGAGLIRSVINNATVPVIETGTGNCHIYVDSGADIDMATAIIENAKTQRMGVCNACESLVIHSDIAEAALPKIAKMLQEHSVEIRGCERTCKLIPSAVPAAPEDYKTEYLGPIISCIIVDSLDEAIGHINNCSTGHSESIITHSYENSQRFLDEIDSAAVYVNASTRFTDGFEFGYGAEIGISTQKLHARGPMGLTALTTTKNIIYGNGQIRR